MPTHESFVHPFRLPHRGEERAHFNFCCTFAQQKTERPRGVVLSLSESLTEFRVRRRERCLIRFLPRPVRGRKHFARSERRIVRCQRTTEAQSAANLSRKSDKSLFRDDKKWLCHFFDSLRERPRGVVLCQPLIVDAHHAADRGAADARRHVGRAGLDRLELAVRADRHHGGVLA